jgi:hypothetical protein
MSSRKNAPRPSGSSRRIPTPPVKKPFPWGLAAGSAVLAVLLVGLVAYAAVNQGSGVRDVLGDLDGSIESVEVAEAGTLSRNHVATPVSYDRPVPMGGDHHPTWQNCGVYAEPIAPEHAVHSLEHGAAWVTYSPDLPEEQVERLTGEVQGDPYRLMSPVPGQDSPVLLTAWGRQLAVDSADDRRVDRFLDGYTNGPQTPERGATCQGGTSATGPLQAPPVPAAPESPAPEGSPGVADGAAGTEVEVPVQPSPDAS